jgi:aspartate racemase
VKRLGLIGGISPESTEIYCRLLNAEARRRLGGDHSARFFVNFLDYGEIIALYHARDWPRFIDRIIAAGFELKSAGAEALMIGSNTSHLAADAAAEAVGLPVIHLLDALAAAMKKAGVKRPILLGTPVVMSGPFYRPALARRYSGEAVIPTDKEQAEIGRIILDELCRGVVTDASRRTLLDIVANHPVADGIILGCTELSMILSEEDCAPPLFDTTALHAAAGAAFGFGEAA